MTASPSPQAQAQQGLTAIMQAVDEYADAFRAAIRPDGGIHFAEGIVAKGKKDMLRAVVERELRASTAAAPSPVPAGWKIARLGDAMVVAAPGGGDCVVHATSSSLRAFPTAVLYALADALLTSAPGAPTPEPKGTE
jgi:hypothetical protein